MFNKGTAFTPEERRELGLLGLLPPHHETLEQQVTRAHEALEDKPTDLERHIYLRQLQDSNATLFYRLLLDHLAELMPIIYTPTVGLACQRYSHIIRRPRGLFIAYPERDEIDAILANAASQQVEVIVVTDGERILGLGDQGAGGMGIPIGKLALYTACGGINPGTALPVLLDAGTNNRERLDDPLYIGWRHERVTGDEYDAFVDAFVRAVKRKFPGVLLQWEDFAQHNANRLLDRYRDQLCTFNDDIQGTAAVTTGALLAAVAATGERLRDHRVAILGAGSAGCGIAEQLVAAMVEEGLAESEARARFFLIDRPGLLHDGIEGHLPFQRKLAQPKDRVIGWRPAEDQPIGLLDAIEHAHPTILIGVSRASRTPSPRRRSARWPATVERPIVFPLSNPTSRVEATPADLIAWTEGRALVATGSPFDDVEYGGRRHPIAQCNNSYVFPGLGLGVCDRRGSARRVGQRRDVHGRRPCPGRHRPGAARSGRRAPPAVLSESRPPGAKTIAIAVAEAARREGLADTSAADDLESLVDSRTWQPRYLTLKRKRA